MIRSSLALLAVLSTGGACVGGNAVIDPPGSDSGAVEVTRSGATNGSATSAGALVGSSSESPRTGSSGDSAASIGGASAASSEGTNGAAASNVSGASGSSTSGAADSADGGSTDGSASGSTSATSGTTEVCTSGVFYQGTPGPTMDPGDTCPSCHSNFQIAGTVYPTADEPTDCDGVTGSTLSVVITDAKGNVQTLAVNATGNFYSTESVAMPFHAKVISKTTERDMVDAQSIGDCNYCHTPTGFNGAPGRIMAP
jgi:hypothetical protein